MVLRLNSESSVEQEREVPKGELAGMTDALLEELASEVRGKNEGRKGLRSPWLHGLSELYSMGKCWRVVTRWPEWLPITFMSDHGVHFDSDFYDEEKRSEACTHLTWSDWRSGQRLTGKKIFRVTHPWVLYRRFKSYTPSPTRAGTLIVANHSRMSTSHLPYDWPGFIQSMRDLGPEYEPKGILLHMNEIRKGEHLRFRQLGLPLFTAGNTSSPFFVDRFYEILANFRYCSSPSLGSHAFYSEDFGVPFFLHGAEIQHDYEEEKRRKEAQAPRVEYFSRVFSFPPRPSRSREVALNAALCTSGEFETNRRLVLRLLVRGLFELPLVIFRILRNRGDKNFFIRPGARKT